MGSDKTGSGGRWSGHGVSLVVARNNPGLQAVPEWFRSFIYPGVANIKKLFCVPHGRDGELRRNDYEL